MKPLDIPPTSGSRSGTKLRIGNRSPGPNVLLVTVWTLVLALTAIFSKATSAGERRFTFVYEATTVPEGQVEFENWVTWKRQTPDDSSFDRFEFRHELEFGLTDKVQLAVYLADWSYQDGRSVERDRARYNDSALELIINFLDPTADGFGLASYHEVKFGDELFEIENKLILQKNMGQIVLAYNLTLEAAWEGDDFRERSGEISQTAGLSYEVAPSLLVGAELLYEVPLPDWKTGAKQSVWFGPNFSYRFGGENDWWVTVTALKQITDTDDEPDFQFRLIFGMSF